MDRVAIISDVHGNITALKSVMQDIESRNINNIYFIGDCVSKGCNPDLVIDLLKDKCKIMVKGNCDEVICRPDVPKDKFWSRKKIGEDRAKFIYDLPVSYDFYMSGYLIRLFHSSPFGLDYMYSPMFSNENTKYSTKEINDPLTLFENTDFIKKAKNDPIPDIIGYGHIHTPNIFRIKNKTIFNPGSVGIPNEMLNDDIYDQSNKFSTVISYAILEGNLNSKDFSSISISIVRLPYDIEKEIKLLELSTLPNKDVIIQELRSAVPIHCKQ